ncbi:MAG: ATP-binding protein, partial [Planctomycetota bacterium]|nr:ATP-binding protein [Planctomycetota bacterium]
MSLTPLSPDDLAWACDGGDCDGGDASAGNLIGQERAIEAMQLGLELYGPGYNIFVSGLTGTRRGQGVKALIEEIRAVCRPVPDRLFVHNFDEPHRPKLVTLPRGLGGKLVADVDRFCRGLRATLPEAFGSATFNDRHKAIQKQYVSRQQLALHDVMEASDKAGLTLVRLGDEEHSEPDIYPAVDGKPVPMEALEVLVREGHLTGDQVEQLGLDRDRLLTKLHEARATSRQLALEMRGRLEDLERETAERVVEPLVNDLRGAWAQPELRSHFDAVQEFAIDNAEPLIAFFDGMARTRLERRPRPFDIYLMPRGESSVQDDGAEECPVLFEANPTLENLFGTILPPGEDGPRLSHLEAGALLRADGGYLLVRLADVVQRPEVWPMLKSVLKTGILEIRPVESGRGPVSPLRPDPIEIQPKVVVIGEPGTYELLCREDPEFRKVFKVHAQFDTTMPNDAKNRAKYGAFVRGLVQSEGVHPSSGTGVGRLAEVGARLAGSRQRLSTRFGDLADLYREASHLAETGGRKLVERDDLLTAE